MSMDGNPQLAVLPGQHNNRGQIMQGQQPAPGPAAVFQNDILGDKLSGQSSSLGSGLQALFQSHKVTLPS